MRLRNIVKLPVFHSYLFFFSTNRSRGKASVGHQVYYWWNAQNLISATPVFLSYMINKGRKEFVSKDHSEELVTL